VLRWLFGVKYIPVREDKLEGVFPACQHQWPTPVRCLPFFCPLRFPFVSLVFTDRQLKVIQGLFSELAWRAHGGILLDLGFFDLHLQSVAWAMLWASIAVFWMSKILRSPLSHVVVAILGAALGGVVGFCLDASVF